MSSQMHCRKGLTRAATFKRTLDKKRITMGGWQQTWRVLLGHAAPSLGPAIGHDDYEAVRRAWSGAAKFAQHKALTLNDEPVHIEADLAQLQKYWDGTTDVHPRSIDIHLTGGPHRDANLSHSLVELYLHDLFLTLNLSVPGCADFSHITLGSLTGPSNLEVLELAGYYLAPTGGPSKLFDWPPIRELEFERVWNWLNSLEIGTRQVAASSVERGLFALLHACKGGSAEPAQLMWLAHALESLYDTPVATVGKILRDRLLLFLGTPDSGSQKVKGMITKFYEVRSQFAHGSLDIVHPLIDDGLDPRIHAFTDKIDPVIDFGFACVVATFQELIERDWKSLVFNEVVAES
ncbi:MAG TPA: hypothetical protein VEQ60_28910 [Longimicrobium sp.]|nr:hypothetical protein [Longimicrobium sp.]